MATKDNLKFLDISLDAFSDDPTETGKARCNLKVSEREARRNEDATDLFALKILDVAFRWVTHFSPSTTNMLRKMRLGTSALFDLKGGHNLPITEPAGRVDESAQK